MNLESHSLTASFHTLGCKLNYAETSTYARQLSAYGIEVREWGEACDVVVINSCAVTEQAQKQCRQMMHRVRREHPNALIVLSGCYAELSTECLYDAGADLVVRRAAKGDLGVLVAERLGLFPLGRTCFEEFQVEGRTSFFSAYSQGDRTRAFLKVQDGCSYGCTYCTIPLARGRSRSGRIATLAQQARLIASQGTKEIVIAGINTGDFGADTGESFLDLLSELDGVEGIARYRISSIEPNLLTDRVLDLMASSEKILPHIHVPLQSGDDSILSAMRRRYTTALYRERIEAARLRMPGLFVGVDVIVGFPGETSETFRNTYKFLEALAPSNLHVFPYSKRPHTLAASMPGHLAQEVKRHYTSELLALANQLHEAYAAQSVGEVRPVLVERIKREGFGEGFTDNYLRVEFTCGSVGRGEVVEVQLDRHVGHGLLEGTLREAGA